MKINKGMRYEGWGKSLASTLRTLAMVVAGLFAIDAKAAGFDGKTLVTNSWFDANFTALTANTDITQGSDTGITLGAGSWTSVPATATAQIVADADAGGEATLLSVDIDTSDLLTFSPAPNAITSGYETVSVDIKTDPVYDLPTLDNTVQGAFLLYMDGEENLSLQGYTDNGWTNLVGATASDLTNVWLTVYTDYATVSNVRYVRYSVKLGDTLTILHDSSDTTWFPSAATSKTALESVSFLGSGKIRTFSGKELLEPVATYNGVNYGTVADAIAAAEEGGTVTLVKGATEAALSITKDITLDLAEYTTSIPYISIAEGKTLTLKRANKQNKIGYFTGGGNLVVSGNNTFRWEGVTGTSTLASITQESTSGGIYILGYGTINVSGDVTVNAKLTITPSPYSSNSDDTHEIYLNAESVSVGELAGAGVISTTDGVTANAGSFSGKITGEGGLAANGTSGLTLSGLNSFAGSLNVGANANLAISSSLDGISTMFRLDASDEDSIVLSEDNYVTNWLSQVNDYSFSKDESVMTLTTDYFGGKKAVRTNKSSLNSSFTVSSSRFSSSVIAAVRLVEAVNTGGSMILGANGVNGYWIGRRGTGSDQASWKKMNGSKNENTDGFWQSGVYGDRTFHTDKERTLATLSWNRNANMTTEYVGGSASDIVIAEIIGFDRTNPDIATIKRIEAYLANKWGMTDMGTHLPVADVTVATGGVLDLGGTTQTVASFTGGGTVQNGTLITADNVYTNTGALNMPVVAGAKVVIGEGATALTLVGNAGTMTIEFSDEFIASNGSITISATGLTEDNFKNAPSDIFRYGLVDNGDGTWTLGPATSFEAATYTWSPVGNSTDWTSTANWKVGEQSVAVVPQTVDTVVFPASEEPDFTGWTVALGENRTVASVTFSADVTLKGAVLFSSGYTGDGAITLGDDAGLANNETAAVTIANDIIIAGTGTHTNILYSYKKDLTVSGGLSGAGNVELKVQYDQQGVILTGNNTMTSGSITAKAALGASSGSGRRNLSKVSANSTNSKLVWQISTGDGSKSGPTWTFARESDQTYYFGSVGTSSISDGGYAERSIWEIGALGSNDTLAGSMMYSSRWGKGNTIRKVGAGDLSMTMSHVYGYDVKGGTLTLKSNNARPHPDGSIIFTGTGTLVLDDAFTVDVSTNIAAGISTAPIKVDTGTVAREWEVAIPANSASALVKSGSSTLTLSAAPLAETFEISVEAGKVVAPKTATNMKPAKGTKCTENGDNYEYEKGPEIENGATASVEGLANQDAADAVAATYNVTLTDAQVTQGLETSYYKVIATQVGETTTYTMSVVLNEAEVGVDFGEEEDTVEPVVFTGSAPTFQLKECVKKGLYYSVGTVASPTATEVTVLAEQQATADGQEISLTPTSMAFGAGSVIYYKLSVSDTTQVTNN